MPTTQPMLSLLLTDLYQLTMAQAYWKSGRGEKEAVFQMFFRRHPFDGGFTVACGLQTLMDVLTQARFDDSDVDYLATLTGQDGQALFDADFLATLRDFRLTCDIDAIPEGTIVFPFEPLVRVTGPLVQAQLLETIILNIINFQTLIATKAARICIAAQGEPVIEFGLRRAQGPDGGLSASRAAYVGGCVATSNVLAGKVYGIPVRGTHAHSWVMSFDDEREAFRTYAETLPNNCVFLVDTYDTLEGVRRAIEVGHWLREQGHEMVGIRLDSGDLAYLSIEARKLLDAAGFPDAMIVASNDLDETIINSLKQQGACINVWGVGTKLVTGYDQPTLGGVYKLTALRDRGADDWRYCIKLSEQAVKISTPGIHQVRRYSVDGELVADAIYDVRSNLGSGCVVIDPLDPTRRKRIPPEATYEDLLVPVFRQGVRVYEPPPLDASRHRAQSSLARLSPGLKRFVNPHIYPVGLEQSLYDLKMQLVLQARGSNGQTTRP
ncbi:MAG: nicotinate phosphoribosyltransferase [Chloracidobacterium sp.]|uniref:Nicotinate phosphoribosyltransferase n=1 Tax=Chloracidobacterium validum TaxID=2821543 RepID=A0ABX8BBE2_9BACT|nr:nicotinate phosphoribosyltransferase [Chloracidobacterium validum]QUW04257.1 nicotinate phosphoribosyltransferase [Chloracidobacterium validum]